MPLRQYVPSEAQAQAQAQAQEENDESVVYGDMKGWSTFHIPYLLTGLFLFYAAVTGNYIDGLLGSGMHDLLQQHWAKHLIGFFNSSVYHFYRCRGKRVDLAVVKWSALLLVCADHQGG